MTGRRTNLTWPRSVVADPFTAPETTHQMADAPPRSQVVVGGTVATAGPVRWAGGQVLEAEITDGTGSITLVFLGRDHLGGIEPARRVVAAGTLGRHRGRTVILNPQIWLTTHPAPTVGAGGFADTELASA